MPSIDTHFHVFCADSPVVAHARYRPGYSATLAQWRTLAARSGVTRGVLVQPSFQGTNHHDLLAALATDPASLRGVATLAADTSAATIRHLHDAGIRGLRWNLAGVADVTAFADGAWRVVLEQCHPLAWHLEIHGDTDRMAWLLDNLAPCPLPLVIDHFGKPLADESSIRQTLAAAARQARDRPVLVKLSAPYRLPGVDVAMLANRWCDLLGPRALLWGSDWPWTNHEAGRDYASLQQAWHDWFDNEAASLARHADANACRLFGWPDSAAHG